MILDRFTAASKLRKPPAFLVVQADEVADLAKELHESPPDGEGLVTGFTSDIYFRIMSGGQTIFGIEVRVEQATE